MSDETRREAGGQAAFWWLVLGISMGAVVGWALSSSTRLAEAKEMNAKLVGRPVQVATPETKVLVEALNATRRDMGLVVTNLVMVKRQVGMLQKEVEVMKAAAEPAATPPVTPAAEPAVAPVTTDNQKTKESDK